MPRLDFHAERPADATPQRLRAKKAAVARREDNAVSRAEVLERLALELATLPAVERKALLECFAAPVHYETADELELRPR